MSTVQFLGLACHAHHVMSAGHVLVLSSNLSLTEGARNKVCKGKKHYVSGTLKNQCYRVLHVQYSWNVSPCIGVMLRPLESPALMWGGVE